MADISKLSRLVSGVQRQVDLSTNTLVVGALKVGSTTLSETILGRLISLQNGSDVDATYHTHDGRYFTETELGNASGTTGSDLIGDDNNYSNFTPAAATVKGALSGIDTALASGSGRVKITAADTTSDYLNASIVAGSALSSTVNNPGANETLNLDVNVDGSTIEVSSDALRVKDAGVTAAKLAANSVETAKIVDANVTNAKIASGIDATKIADGSVDNTEFQRLNGVTGNIQTQLDAKVAKAGSAMDSAANITFSGGGEVLGLPSTPSAAGAAASKAYVDAVALGLAPKKAVKVATLTAGTLASSFENGDTIDGITLVTGDRILIKDQASAAENGIYTVNASGAPTRATDFDSLSPIDEINGAWVPVQLGTQAGKIFVQYGAVATLGTDPINFEFYNPIASLIGGDMVSVTGSTITLDLSTAGGLKSTNPGDPAGQLSIKLEASNPSLQIDGSNQLGAKLDGAGALSSGASGLKANVDASTIEISSNALQVKDAGITAAKLATDSVTTAKIVDANVTAAKLATDSVTTAKIVDANVTTAKIADANVTAAKLATDSVTTAKILDANVTTAKIADSNVTTAKIADANVTLAKLASDSVDENKIVSTAHDATMTGGSGSKLSVASSPRGLKSMVAGEAMAANTSFLVRFAMDGETAGRVYKADQDATTLDKFYAVGICLKTTAASAGDAIDMTFEGTHTLGSSDAAFASADIGKPVYLTAAGAFSVTAPTTANYAVYRIGVVEATNKIWVGGLQVNGVN